MLPDSLSSARRHRRLPACSAGVWAPFTPRHPALRPPRAPRVPSSSGCSELGHRSVLSHPQSGEAAAPGRALGGYEGCLAGGWSCRRVLSTAQQPCILQSHPPWLWRHENTWSSAFFFVLHRAPRSNGAQTQSLSPLSHQAGTLLLPAAVSATFFPQHPKNPWLQSIPAWGGGGLGSPVLQGELEREPPGGMCCASRVGSSIPCAVR